MIPPSGDASTLVEDDLLGEDWFGEGSPFESGEKLAAALITLARAGGDGAPEARLALPPPSAPELSPVPPASGPIRRPAPVEPAPGGEFQVAVMPSFRADEAGSRTGSEAGSTGWSRAPAPAPGGRAQRTGWSIRQSVQMLRLTEEALRQLRREAAELAWQWAADALLATDGG